MDIIELTHIEVKTFLHDIKKGRPSGPPFSVHLSLLLLVALGAVCGIAGLECLGAVVALAAVLAGVHVCHGVLAALLHREDLGVAVIALQALVCMNLAIKHDLSRAAACKVDGLSRRHRKSAAHKCHDHQNHYCQYCLLHLHFLLLYYSVAYNHLVISFSSDTAYHSNYEPVEKEL